jgi:hypothetical protein
MSCSTPARSSPHLSGGAFAGQQPGSVMKPRRSASAQVDEPHIVPPPVELDDALVELADAVAVLVAELVAVAVCAAVVPPPPCPPDPVLVALCCVSTDEHAWTPPSVTARARANQAKGITRIDRLLERGIRRHGRGRCASMQAFSGLRT